MTVTRRGSFALGAFGLGVAAFTGCSATGARRLGATMGPDDVERLLAQLDRVVARLSELEPDPSEVGVQGGGAEVERGRERSVALLTALCFLGTYRELPPAVRDEPRIAAHIARSLPRLQRALDGARVHLAAMSEARLDGIDRRLLQEPELPMEIMERVDRYARELDVPIEQRTYLRVSTAQLAGRFRREGTRWVARKLVASFDKVIDARIAALAAFAPPPRRRSSPADIPELRERAAADGAAHLVGFGGWAPRGVEGESCVTEDDCEHGLSCERSECRLPGPNRGGPRSERIRETAGDVAEVGLWLLIPPACAIGVMVLLVSLFIVIVSGIVRAGEE